MGSTGDLFNSLSLLYLLGAGFAVFQIAQHRREFWDNRITMRDRQLSAMVAFFLLVPVGVLLHELGHMVAAATTSSQVLGLHYFVYWGYVEFIPSSGSPLLAWYVALAGNFVSYLLGFGALILAMYARPIKPVLRVVLAQLGVLELVQTLLAYPLMSFLPDFVGDWRTIYSFQAPVASVLTLAVHVASLAVFLLIIQRNERATYLLTGARRAAT